MGQWTQYLQVVRRGFGLLRGRRGLFAFVLAVNLVGSLLSGVGDPLFLKLLIDSLERKDLAFFLALAGGLLVLYTLVRGLNFASGVLVQKLKNELCETTARELFDTFYEVPYARVRRRDDGYFVARIYDEPAKLTEVVDLMVKGFSSAVMFTGALVVCLWLSWQVAIALSVVVPVLLYLSGRFGSKISESTVRENEEEAALREGLGRAVRSYKTVRLFGLLEGARRRVADLVRSYLDTVYQRSRLASLFQAASGTFLSYAEMSVIVGAGIQVLRGQMTVGGLFGFISAYWRAVNGFRAITSLTPALARVEAQFDRIDAFRALAGPTAPTATVERGLRDGVELQGVRFGYDGNALLDAVELSIKKGERVLVTGPNGCGKSTLAHLITGFLEPSAGIARLPELSRVSSQLHPWAFPPGTVRELVERDELSDSQRQLLRRLVQDLGLGDKLDRDPEDLSSGERRKVQILLTLLKDADVYVFDEPLANVDEETRDRVMAAILDRTRGKSLLVIQHGEERYRRHFDRWLDLAAAGMSAPWRRAATA